MLGMTPTVHRSPIYAQLDTIDNSSNLLLSFYKLKKMSAMKVKYKN